MNLCGVILSGGRCTRMGGEDKALLSFAGQSFLAHAISSLAFLDNVYISVDTKERYPEYKEISIEDRYQGIGPMGGILSTLSVTGADAILVLTCDMPLISAEILMKMKRVFNYTGEPVLVQCQETIYPFPGIYTKRMLADMEQMSAEGNYRMMNLWKSRKYRVIRLQEDEKEMLSNINSPKAFLEMKTITN